MYLCPESTGRRLPTDLPLLPSLPNSATSLYYLVVVCVLISLRLVYVCVMNFQITTSSFVSFIHTLYSYAHRFCFRSC